MEAFCDEKVAELEAKIMEIGAENVAAFIAEPVMASGGVIVPPDGYYKRCHAVCKKHDVLFIADEVVTSFGRLGHFFASEAVFGGSSRYDHHGQGAYFRLLANGGSVYF